MKKSPEALTRAWLEGEGWLVDKVTYWHPFARKTFDLFGFGDLIAAKGDRCVIVQATSASNMAARRKKIEDSDKAWQWLEGRPHHAVWVVGWRRKGREWVRRVVEIGHAKEAVPPRHAPGDALPDGSGVLRAVERQAGGVVPQQAVRQRGRSRRPRAQAVGRADAHRGGVEDGGG